MKASPKLVELEFISIQMFNKYCITSIKEGVVFTNEHREEMFTVFDTYYGDNSFVSIANREYDYTIDPTTLGSKTHPNILGIGVVVHKETSKSIVIFEKKFYKGDYEVFNTLKEAISWAESFLLNNKNSRPISWVLFIS